MMNLLSTMSVDDFELPGQVPSFIILEKGQTYPYVISPKFCNSKTIQTNRTTDKKQNCIFLIFGLTVPLRRCVLSKETVK